MSDDLIEEVREMGEHPSRADLPMGKTLRNTAEYMEALEGQVQSWTEEARRYAENADYWRAKCEALRADKAAHAATVEGILKAHEAFKQDVSDAVDDTKFMVETHCDTEALALVSNRLNRFIIAKPDPLVAALGELADRNMEAEQAAETLRKALQETER